jgi:hypothetical protein
MSVLVPKPGLLRSVTSRSPTRLAWLRAGTRTAVRGRSSAPAASFATDSSANLAPDDDQAFDEPAMPRRFLPLAALIYVLVSLTAHAQTQEAAPGGVRGRILDSAPGWTVPAATVHLVRNQGIHVTVEADTAGESWFDHVPEDQYAVEVEGQSCLKAIRADERIALRRAAAVEFAPVSASGTTGASNLTSRGLRPRGPEFMIAESSWQPCPTQGGHRHEADH